MTKDVAVIDIESEDDPFDIVGEHRFKVDAKGRVALPAEFRKVLSGKLVVTVDPSGKCLSVYEKSAFNDWVNKLFHDRYGGFNASDPKQIGLYKKIRTQSRIVEIDSSGRIGLKQDMRDKAGIKKDVVLSPGIGCFDIWDEDAFDSYMDSIDLNDFYSESPANVEIPDGQDASSRPGMPLSFV